MDEACAATSGAMAAMIGADENTVRALAADADVDIANINAPGQIVISGERAKVEIAVGLAKEHGIRRATMLNVAGAYHSRLMESAYEKLGTVLQHVPMQPPRFPVISNVTGEEVKTPNEIRRTLQDQVTGTVRWLDCMERLVALGAISSLNWGRVECWQAYCGALLKASTWCRFPMWSPCGNAPRCCSCVAASRSF